MQKALLTIAVFTLATGSAYAQGYDDMRPSYRRQVRPLAADRVDPAAVGPRVYGWRDRGPTDCGTFRYWNGSYCADARFDPPIR